MTSAQLRAGRPRLSAGHAALHPSGLALTPASRRWRKWSGW
jgi:hypothetical protein